MRRMMLAWTFLMVVMNPVSCMKSEDTASNKETRPSVPENRANSISNVTNGIRVVLNHENNFIDQLEHGCFTRAGHSGPGTGPFVGEGFEFAKGSCWNIDNEWLETHGWTSHTLGCSRMLLSSDWCARLEVDHAEKYTLHFLSWTIGPTRPEQRCMGDCESNENQTVYVRTKVQ